MSRTRSLLALCIALGAPSAAAQVESFEEFELLASDAELGDGFGRSLAASGRRVVIGAPRDDAVCPLDPDCDSGAAYVFARDAATGVWTQEAKLTPSTHLAGDLFGSAVAISGDVVVVGAPGFDRPPFTPDPIDEPDRANGAVFVFVRSGTTWTEEAALVAGDAEARDWFGAAVALDGVVAVIGAPFADPSGSSDAGKAYVYERVLGIWTEQAILVAGDAAPRDRCASSVALQGDTIVLGAPRKHAGTVNAPGAAYVFRGAGTSWVEEAKLVASAPDDDGSDEFGSAVDVSGDTALVGARFANAGGDFSGAGHVFVRGGTVWTLQETLGVPLAGLSRLGASVALEGDTALLGAPHSSRAGRESGSAFVFERSGTAWTVAAELSHGDAATLDRFGFACDLAFDADAGELRAVVGAWTEDSAAEDEGAAYAFRVPAVFDHFCSGDGGDQLGCTDCPCGNNATPGTYGGCLNSVASSGRLLARGRPSLTLDSLRFELRSGNPNTFAVLTSGAARAPATPANPCFGLDSGLAQAILDGLRCVVQGVTRHGARPMDGAGDVGLTTSGWGPPNGPPGGLAQLFLAGQTRHWQVIYREDPALSCMTGQNTTDAITTVFVP